MSQTEFKLIDAYRCDCPGCGNAMRYDIRTKGMLCDNCGESRNVHELRQDEALAKADEFSVITYTCPSCGATLNTNSSSSTSFCSYCGSDVVLTPRLTRIRRPSSIVPFRITREECERKYRRYISSTRFVPQALDKQETIDHFRPVYIPYWLYRFNANGETTGIGVRKYSDGLLYQHQRDYRE